MREEKDARTRGKVCVDEDIPRANLELSEKRAKASQGITAVSNLSVQKYIILSYSSRKRIDLKRKRQKKCEKNAKNMINVAAYFETSFKHVRYTLNPTRKHDTPSHTKYDDIHHTVYFIVRL